MIVPEGWRDLQHPERRATLLDTLKELGDPTYQQAAWIGRSIDRHPSWPRVVEQAKIALALLEQRGMPVYA